MKKVILALLLVMISFPVLGEEKESAYDRVMRTGTIRCGYILYPPQLMKDSNTGKITGLSVDIIEHIAQELNLKIEWTEETGTASMIEGLKSNRFDLICNTVWENSSRAREAYFTNPVFFTAIYAYTHIDNNVFDNNLAILNDKKYKIATMDGSASNLIAQTDYPLAQNISLPELTDFTHLLIDVASKKVDVTFSEKAQTEIFIQKNPNTIKKIPTDYPVRVFANSFMMNKGEDELLQMLNSALRTAMNNGKIDSYIKTYETSSKSFLRVAKPYEVLE